MEKEICFKHKKHKLISTKITKKAFLVIIYIFLFELFLFPTTNALANNNEINDNLTNDPEIIEVVNEIIENNTTNTLPLFENNLPQTKEWKTSWSGYYTVTAYNSEVGQCDDTPCVSANGFNLCEHGIEDSVATNMLKFGTKIRIPEIFGDKVFVVRDRMNKRYTNRFDIWMINKADAKKFGKKITKIEILEVP